MGGASLAWGTDASQNVLRAANGADSVSALTESALDDREDRPVAGDAAQLLQAAAVEVEARADDGAGDRPRDEDLPRSRQAGAPRGDVHRHAADVRPDQLALARVQPRADLEAEAVDAVDDRLGAPQRLGRRAVEGDEERVADRLDLMAAEAVDLAADAGVVRAQQVAPARVAE